jgi:hypothetical protein
MTQHDIYVILSSTLTSDEKERVWLASQAHADDVYHTDLTLLVRSMVVPCEDLHWDYQAPPHTDCPELYAYLPPYRATDCFP